MKVGDRVRLRTSYCNWLGNVKEIKPDMPYPIRVTWDMSTQSVGAKIGEGTCLESELSVVNT